MTKNKKTITLNKNFKELEALKKYDFYNQIGKRIKSYRTSNKTYDYLNYVYEVETKTGKKKAYFQIKGINHDNGFFVYEVNYDMFL